MMLLANEENIEKLLEQLYEHKRVLQSSGIDNPTFVFFVRKQDRYEIERRFLSYLAKFFYGNIEDNMKLWYGGATDKASVFHFPGSDAAVVLLEKEGL